MTRAFGVDLIDAGACGFGGADRGVETGKQIRNGFVGSATQHRQGPLAIMGDSGVADWRDGADHDLAAAFNDRRDVRQCSSVRAGHGGNRLERGRAEARYAACRRASSGFAAMFHGSSSSMRLIGCSAIRSSTCRKYKYGSMSLRRAVAISV